MQLVGKQIIQRNHPDKQEIGSLYYLFAKNLYNKTSCNIQKKLINLLVQIVRKLQLPSNDDIIKLLLELQISIKAEYKSKSRLTNKLSKQFNLLKCRENNRKKYLSTYLACTKINMKIEITEIFISFVIIDNLLYKHHGKFKIEDKHRLVFIIWLWTCKIWSNKVQLAKLKDLLPNRISSRFFRCYQNQNPASNYGKSFTNKCKFCIQKISTNLYEITNKLLIHADINDSLNISRRLVPVAFS
ncbi:MAG: hypothetical protein EAZ76_08535 [Nostocales cyanobacterium]|nr:MAG: hypothetical protein EAZ87_06460 [Nostocales cyanobacterium]TAF15479.1 MAG: hypothetical protein EAZ76_08535 [Nostocales cyanobacterium]